MACLRFSLQEFLTPEVFVLQEQMSALQVKLDEEEHKNLKLQQHIDRLEHHSTQMQEVRPGAWPQKCVKQIGKGRKRLRRASVGPICVVFSTLLLRILLQR